jgi:predicted Holliday junction resolvase-like endonuclease
VSEYSTFFKEIRHIFSICPECGSVHRLSELELSRRGKYVPDWMDKIEKRRDALAQRHGSLDEKASGLQRAAREKATLEVLPGMLRRAAPIFFDLGIDPRDVRTISHPIDFVVFHGMGSSGGVQGVTLLSLTAQNALTKSIGVTIDGKNIGWRTIRVGDDGVIVTEE